MSIAQWDSKKVVKALELWDAYLCKNPPRSVSGLCEDACLLLQAKDGRFTTSGLGKKQQKAAYGYQMQVLAYFDREVVQRLEANKTSKDSLVISHMCGTRNCIRTSHLRLESKRVNDERTHCHFCLSNYLATTGVRAPQDVQRAVCSHGSEIVPYCGESVVGGVHSVFEEQ